MLSPSGREVIVYQPDSSFEIVDSTVVALDNDESMGYRIVVVYERMFDP